MSRIKTPYDLAKYTTPETPFHASVKEVYRVLQGRLCNDLPWSVFERPLPSRDPEKLHSESREGDNRTDELSVSYSSALPSFGRPPVPLFRTKRLCALVSFQPHSGHTPDVLPTSEYSHRTHASNFLRGRLGSLGSRNFVRHSQHLRVTRQKSPAQSPSVITRTSKLKTKPKAMRTKLAKLSTSFVSVLQQFGHGIDEDITSPNLRTANAVNQMRALLAQRGHFGLDQ